MTATEITAELLAQWPLPEPGADSDKYGRGSVLIVGGSATSPGGVALAGLAALRAGAGRLQLAVAEPAAVALAVSVIEAMVVGLTSDGEGDISRGAARHIEQALAETDVACIGPGLMEARDHPGFVAELYGSLDSAKPLVIDAFALGALARLSAGGRSPGFTHAVLTPNLIEAGQLLGLDSAPADPASAALQIAEKYSCAVILHGFTAAADGKLWSEPLAGPGLGTSGSGDVLAGIVTGLLARGADPVQAAVWAVHAHAAAGASLPHGYLARDLIGALTL